MLTVKQQEKVFATLREIGIAIPKQEFCEGRVEDTSLPLCIQRYESQTLRLLTGLMKVRTERDYEEGVRPYDINLINKIADAFLASDDEELRKIAWNSFWDCAKDERFNQGQRMLDTLNESWD